jgi:ubiquinone/menaquinone biosynthesis C-methylase UbiE
MSPRISLEHVERNASAHDRVAHAYDEKHAEIYNPVEQARLGAMIDEVLRLVAVARPEVLDFGAGTGNLSLKFAQRGCRVTAVDVSERSLERLRARVAPGQHVATARLAGDRLPFADRSFDVVATYSVLHHVPDYLQAVREMARVLRPGGLVYIDHEFNDAAWHPDASLAEYRRRTRLSLPAHVWQLVRTGELFTADFAKTAFMKAFVNRRYEREGDLHVWPDDHVEWSKITATLEDAGFAVVKSHDYLLYQPRGGMALYEAYAKRCSDLRCLVARKAG